MKRPKLTILMIVLGLLATGCAAPRTAPEKEDVSVLTSPDYSLVVSPKGPVSIVDAEGYREGDDLVVTGRVKRLHEINLPGHMHLYVYSPDGTLLAQETSRVPGLSSNRRGSMKLPFSFRLHSVPPEGAKIRVEYHAPSING